MKKKVWIILGIATLLFLAPLPVFAGTVICGNCSKSVPATAKKCPYCGAEFEDFECPSCHRTIPTSSEKCPYCHYDFTGKKKPSTTKAKKKTERTGAPQKTSEPGSSSDRFFYDIYFRLSARTDFGNGSKTLGWWPLYGRLMNETNWFTFGFGGNLIQPKNPGDPTARVYMRVEGDSFRTGDARAGNLSAFAITQFNLESKNLPFRNYITQVGTLWYDMGYIGIYDMYIGQTFWETVGIRIGQRDNHSEWFIGVGDSGYDALKQRKEIFSSAGYNTIPTLGGLIKKQFASSLWMGTSLMIRYETGTKGNKNSLHQTSGIDYRDVLRGDVLKKYLDNNPSDPNGDSFPGASPVSSDLSWRWTGWIGYGNKSIGLQWNDLSMSFENKPAQLARRFTYNGITKDVYLSKLTDDRYEFTLADESQWVIVKDRLDMVLAALVGYGWDQDNRYLPDDTNRLIASIVVRPQFYLTEHIHWLTELSFAMEKSLLGNRYREHWNSIQSNTGGQPDPDGLEWGDTDTKYTFQMKTGLVLNLKGKGIYNRPSIRLLFGLQYSNVHAAFSNSFNESLDRQNRFNSREDIHWHYSVSIEVEHWF